MIFSSTRFPISVLATTLTAVFAMGCNEHAPLRDNANAQNNALSQAKFDEIAPAEGVFSGKMVIKQKNAKDLEYDCTLTIQHVTETVRTGTSPTETVDVPKLTAGLEFAVFEGMTGAQFEAAADKYPELVNAMGYYPRVSTDAGNYRPATRSIGFNYQVAGDTLGNFGDIIGKLSQDGSHFIGKWTVRRIKYVATFDLVRQK